MQITNLQVKRATWEVEARRLQVQDQPGQHNEIPSKKQKSLIQNSFCRIYPV